MRGNELQDVINFVTGVVDGPRPGVLCMRMSPLPFKN